MSCEITFWIVIILGLVTRYVFKKQTLGLVLLALTPVIDILLLIVTGVDLYNEQRLQSFMGLQRFILVYLLHLEKVWSVVLGIDFIISCSYFIWPRKEKKNYN